MTQKERSKKFADNALKSFNRRPFIRDHAIAIQSLDELAQCMDDAEFRGAFLGEYGLLGNTKEQLAVVKEKYNLPENAENTTKGLTTRVIDAAKRFCNPLYNYNIGGVTREVQTDLAYRLAEIYHAEHTIQTIDAQDAAIKDTIKNAKFRETKDVLLAYVLETNKVYVQVPKDLVTQNPEEEKALHYAALRDEVFTTYDKVFTQRRQAATIDLAIYGKAALIAGPLGILGAYALRAGAGTALGTINSHVGKIAAAGSLFALSGFGAVAGAYAAKGGLDYLAHWAGKTKHEKTHNGAKWSAGILSYLMPFIAGADYIHNGVTNGANYIRNIDGDSSAGAGKTGAVDENRLGECPVSPHERSLETCPVNTCDAFPSLQGDIRELQIKETYLHHGTPFKGEQHELGLHLDKKEFDEGFVTVKGLHDNHTPNGYDVDKTVVMAEGYDTAGKLAFRQLYDVDTHGKFTLNGFDETQYKSWQITWAEAECKNDTLHLTDLASYTRGKVPVDGFVHLPADHNHVPETPHAHLPPVEPHTFDIRYFEIPQNSKEQLVVGVHDSFGDGIEYDTKITDAHGDLVELTRYRHALGVTDAIQGGYIPEFAKDGHYHLQSWGHDFPQIAADAEPELGWYIQEVSLSSGLSLHYLIIPDHALVQLPEEDYIHTLVAPEFFNS